MYNHMYMFQKGLLVSSHSLQKVYEVVTKSYTIKFTVTYRLNQDALEHFFASIRQMGSSCDLPSTVLVKRRIKRYLLASNTALVSENH